jgi:glutamine synthetase
MMAVRLGGAAERAEPQIGYGAFEFGLPVFWRRHLIQRFVVTTQADNAVSGSEPGATARVAAALDSHARTERSARARATAEALRAEGVSMVAVCWVDNTGVTRVKAAPISRLERAAGWGIGMSPVFDVFLIDDSITTSRLIGGPDGDLRLIPDLDRLTVLAGQPGWAWAPADRYTQDGRVYVACQRSFARRMAALARARGLEFRVSFEVEWVVGNEDQGRFLPACAGPAYGMTRVVELSDYGREVVGALEQEGVTVEQFHPEYAAGQLEVSVAPADPVGAADLNVLVRQTIRAVSARFGYQASFAPSVVAGAVGNGAHVHLSMWRGEHNLFAGGTGPHRITADGESFAAGILAALPELSGIGMPSAASYLRLVPSHWAGAYQCWGLENREAALRLVTGSAGEHEARANIEIKCFDAAANPYLAVGSLIAAGLAGMDAGSRLPPEVHGDPAARPDAELTALGVRRLPQTLAEAAGHLAESTLLRNAMGDALFEAIIAVRLGETALFADATPEDVAARTRWRW